ncbi:MAG: thioredoxin domain-containing protein [Vicinamibacterales bacterium]
MANRLARERSPYLLQHQHNPVDWHAWNAEAFAKARTEDKPIFLSIGYSTCHWCHVMERESFESDAIANVLNDGFVSIKVDREERPDVDRVYMAFVQATTGSGGWPMSVFLTPDLQPFFGGTYFPPDSRWGRPGFIDVLREIMRVWRDERPRVTEAAAVLTDRLRQSASPISAPAGSQSVAPAHALDAALDAWRSSFDAQHGGFGGAPKFPRPSELLFLLREHARTGNQSALDMTSATLRAMALGGMHDQLGGGFHRYSVDAKWRVPHFEKMLYDQSQLVLACLEASQAAREPFFADVAAGTLAYVGDQLTDSSGAFYSAEDADSIPAVAPDGAMAGQPHADVSAEAAHATKVEGAFYTWSQAEIAEVTGTDFPVVKRRFGIEPDGNALEDPHGELAGQNVLYVAEPIEDIAIRLSLSDGAVSEALARARQALLAVRARRPRPHLDDKVLSAWNGLMIAAFARAARVLPSDPRAGSWREAAARAAASIRTLLWNGDRQMLLRRYRDGEAAIDGYCEDYASMVFGLLELFQTTGAAEWLEWALRLRERQHALFADDEAGGWFSTSGQDPELLLRMKEDYDGAEPSAGSVAAMNELVIAHLTGARDAFDRADKALARFGPNLGRVARVVPFLASVLSARHAAFTQIVIVGPAGRSDTRALHEAAASRYLPFAAHIAVDPANQEALSALLPWMAGMSMRGGVATAYVCRDFTCNAPVTSPEELHAGLDRV